MGSERGKTWVSLKAESFSCEHVQITHLEGREAISELFKFEVTFVVTEPTEVTEENMLGDRATLSFQYDQEVKRNVHGRIIDVARVFDSSQRFDQYRITIAPHLWGLTMIKQQELYLNMSVPEIIEQKLKAAELGEEHSDFDMRLSRTYPKRDYVVQYRESDFAFISRLMEHEGISYFFEHAGNDKVVFTDNEPSFDPIGGETTVWFSQTGKETDVYHLEETNRFVPANYWLRDYNYVTPQVAVEGTARVDLEWGALGGEILYGQNVRSPEEASSLATIRAEESKARQRIYRGKSDVMRFGAGMTFTLEPPSSKPLNLLVVTLNHRVEQSAMMQGATSEEVDYRNTFEAIPADRTFRPARRTPRPRIHGVMTGFIQTAESKAGNTMPNPPVAAIDSMGRYYVVLDFDTPGRDSRNQGTDALPIRMAQPSAGNDYGMHLPLRPGTEVTVAFLGGDPDRPVIVGAVNNGQALNPVNEKDANKSRIKSQTGVIIQFSDA